MESLAGFIISAIRGTFRDSTSTQPENVEFETVFDGTTRFFRVRGKWVKVTVMEQL